MKILLLSLCLSFISLNHYAQNDSIDVYSILSSNKHKLIELGVGLSAFAKQDLVFSPFIHRDPTFPALSLAYQVRGNHFHSIGVQYASFSPKIGDSFDYLEDGDAETAAPHNFTIVEISYDAGLPLYNTGKELITGGISLLWDIHALNYNYGRISSFGYFSALGLGIHGTYEYAVSNRSILTAGFKLPLLTWFARSPYLVNDDEFIENISSHKAIPTFIEFISDGKFVTLNKLQRASSEIGFQHRFTTHWMVGAEWNFEFIRTAIPRSMLSYQNTLAFKGIYIL